MKLREQIKLVNAALSGTLDLYRSWAKKNHMNYNELVVLYTLDDYGVCTQKQICQWWALPKQTVHGILQGFQEEGYLQVSPNPENKRERLVSFTESGRAFAGSVLDRLHQMEERAMEALGEERRRQLIDCNAAYYDLLRRELENG